uniref:DDE Tnp4 domain-containing protein n=1 Tax=Salix viminalis TaxID=40686 RepID=A0A6N2MVI3_SALVM
MVFGFYQTPQHHPVWQTWNAPRCQTGAKHPSQLTDIIKPTDPDFTNTPIQIAMNRRFMPHFKNCIGAIDGTHVRATISPELQIPFIGRKGVPTQNIMAACSFDMQFTFVWAGWEGSAHDTRIFLEAIHSTSIKFPKPPEGKYYLVDAGYPNEYGYLGPYRGERWKILQCMPPYPYKTQVQIIVASMALNNYIRRRSQHDDVFVEYDRNPDYIPDELLPDVVACETSQSSGRNSRWRKDSGVRGIDICDSERGRSPGSSQQARRGSRAYSLFPFRRTSSDT